MQKIKISILVPICNVEKYLHKCLSSLVNQTLQEIEIICINDGSTDSSLSIIKEFAGKDNRIVVIDKPNSGYGDSMNRGLKIAKGEYIGIVESDDFADLEMFERLYQLAENGHIDIVRSNYYKYWEDKGDVDSFYANISHYDSIINLEIDKKLLLLPAQIWSAIYRREFLTKNKVYFLPTPGASYQDTSFFLKAIFLAQSIVYTENKFLHYRQDNASSSVKQCSLSKVSFVHKEFEETDAFFKQYPEKFSEIESVYNTKKLQVFLWNLFRVDDKIGYLQLMRKDSLDILIQGKYDKKHLSTLQKLILGWVKNNKTDSIFKLLRIRECILRIRK